MENVEIIASSEGGSNFKKIPQGNYVARCYQMILLGTFEETFEGKTRTLTKVRLVWETPTETAVFVEDKGEQPFSVSKDFTLSLDEKANLRKCLDSWRGKAFTEDEAKKFNIAKLVGVPCMLNVIHTEKNGKTYVNIAAVSPMPKGFECPKQVNNSCVWSVLQPNWNVFKTFPEWLQRKIKESKEFALLTEPTVTTAVSSEQEVAQVDDLPF